MRIPIPGVRVQKLLFGIVITLVFIGISLVFSLLESVFQSPELMPMDFSEMIQSGKDSLVEDTSNEVADTGIQNAINASVPPRP